MPLPQDKVFIGMARPAMMAGTHIGALITNMTFSIYAFVFTDSLWMLALGLPLHGVCVLISRYDPHAFRIIGLKLVTTTETMASRMAWRASSRAPYAKRRY